MANIEYSLDGKDWQPIVSEPFRIQGECWGHWPDRVELTVDCKPANPPQYREFFNWLLAEATYRDN